MSKNLSQVAEQKALLSGNLSVVLGLVHEHRSITRSEICQLTGLTRSTVAKLVSNLSDLDLVRERRVYEIDRVGRPSLSVQAVEEVVAISVHPEVDYLEVKAVAFNGQILNSRRIVYPKPIKPAQSVEDMVGLIRDLQLDLTASKKHYRIMGAGVIVPGQIDSQSGIVRQAPHLQWFEVPMKQLLSERLSMKVLLGNDASLG